MQKKIDRNLVVLALVAIFVGGGLVTYANYMGGVMEQLIVTTEVQQSRNVGAIHHE